MDCDACGKMIVVISDAYVEWYAPKGDILNEQGFRIVHNKESCFYDEEKLHKEGKNYRSCPINDFEQEIDAINNKLGAERILLRL